VLTLGEIEKGIGRLPASPRRKVLEQWLREDLVERFAGRLVTVDAEVARVWGRIQAELGLGGIPMGAVDGLLSATARVHELVLVSRNIADFHDPVGRNVARHMTEAPHHCGTSVIPVVPGRTAPCSP
jgi:predicted nucleic acid-binding protein